MKKLFLLFMLSASFGLLEAGYTPAAGPLTLSDAGSGRGMARGAIMKAIVDNDPANAGSDPKLAAANTALSVFDGRGQTFRPYQEIMQNIKQSTNTQAALDAAKAIETVIMHRYDYDTYCLGGYRPTQSILISGIRYWNFFSDDAILKQLIDELEHLANIVSYHSIASSIRLKTTVHSYRHWRRNMLLSIAAYLAADAYKHGYEACLINQFHQHGLKNAPEMAINHAMNLKSGLYNAGKGVWGGAKGAWDYCLKPAGKYIYGGAQAFEDAKSQEKKVEPGVLKNGFNRMRKFVFGDGQKQEEKKNEPNVKKPVKVEIEHKPKAKAVASGTLTDFEKQRLAEACKDDENNASAGALRKKAWRSWFTSSGDIIAAEIDAREKRKAIWYRWLGWDELSQDAVASEKKKINNDVTPPQKPTPPQKAIPLQKPTPPQKPASPQELSDREKFKQKYSSIFAYLFADKIEAEKELDQKRADVIDGAIEMKKGAFEKFKNYLKDIRQGNKNQPMWVDMNKKPEWVGN
jgi:hypothetical protein